MAHLTPAAHLLFAQQHGVASLSQLVDAGLPIRRIEHLERRGDIVSVVRGAYRSASVHLDEAGRCAALSLAHPHLVVAGPTAGRLWGFRRVGSDLRIHVLAPRNWRASSATWCSVFRTDALDRDDVVHRSDGIRVTTRRRTALDLSRHLTSDDHLLSVIEQAAADGGLRDGDLRAVAVDWAHRRPWVRRFLSQLDRRLDGAAAESEPEIVVGEGLVRRGVRGLIRQHRLDLPSGRHVRFDLAVPDARFAVEVDVFPTHGDAVGRRRDAQRDRAVAGLDWTVRRISAQQYRSGREARLDAIASEVRRLVR
ncbi:MAG: hypothetical protein AB8G26_02085 [Ilumatobacter sp.]